jgi:hypothetical protein
MRQFIVKSFVEFHECIERYDQRFTVYRGVSNASYDLIPKIGRPDTKLRGRLEKSERTMLQQFQDRSVPFLSFTPRNEWEWMGLMQHHGAPTRLLDWSRNPLVAAYFSVEKEGANDSAVYAWRSKERPINVIIDRGPFAVTEVRKFIPAHVSERIIAQSGLFTVHPSPTTAMTSDSLEKIVILQGFRKVMKKTLFNYGIHRATLFPGLDGLADHLTWLHVKSH